MGIKGLMPFISDHAPLAVKETEMKALTGRTIAIDACAPGLVARDRAIDSPLSLLLCAAMSLYQFIVAVRQGDSQTNLTNEAGEVTSHIQGFLSRTVQRMELGIPHPLLHPRFPSAVPLGRLCDQAVAEGGSLSIFAMASAIRQCKQSPKTLLVD